MKLSSNFRFLKINAGEYVVFDNFAVDIHLVPVEIFKSLTEGEFKSIPVSLIDTFLEKKILFSSKKDELVFLDVKLKYISEQMKSVNSLYLSFTQRCNLTCNHCDFPKRQLSIENINDLKIRNMVDGWISFIFETNSECAEELWIIPYGGDPLLRKDLLFSLLDYVRNMKLKSFFYQNVKVYIPTNADLMTMEDLCNLAKYPFVHIAFGLDGSKNVHCMSKNVSEKQFDLLCEKIVMSKQFGIDLSISVIGSIELFNDFDNFLILLRDLKVKKMAINFIRNIKVNNSEYLKALSHIYNRHYEELIGLEFQLKKRLSVLEMKLPFRIDCPCYGKQFTLFPDSSVGVCPFEKEGIVDLDTFLSMNYLEKTKIKDTNIKNYHELSIKSGFLYGGGCYWSHCRSCENKSFDELVNKRLFLIIFKKIYHEKL